MSDSRKRRSGGSKSFRTENGEHGNSGRMQQKSGQVTVQRPKSFTVRIL